MGAELTVRQKILLAASAQGSECETFSVEDLIVRTWTMFPGSFSLRGYHAQYPDSNRVLAKLSGSDGLCGLGWLEHVDSRMYRMTRKGKALAKQLATMQAGTGAGALPLAAPAAPPPVAAPPPAPAPAAPAVAAPPPPPPAAAAPPPAPPPPAPPPSPAVRTITAQDIAVLGQIARADALRKFLRGQPLSFSDACAFWGFSPTSRPAQVQQRLDETADLLKRAVETFGEGQQPDPRLPTLSTCYGLFNLHRLMLEKFGRELDALRLPLVAG